MKKWYFGFCCFYDTVCKSFSFLYVIILLKLDKNFWTFCIFILILPHKNWMNFDEILIRYSVWSLLLAYQEPLQLTDFLMSNHLCLFLKKIFPVFFLTEINSYRGNSLKIYTKLIFTDLCPVLYRRFFRKNIQQNSIKFHKWKQIHNWQFFFHSKVLVISKNSFPGFSYSHSEKSENTQK